jgi:hypothetical protein
MARYRKNVKRIDPRYFLHETVERNDDGSALEEGDERPLQAAMKICDDKAKTQQEYDECMKGATPSGKPRSRNVQAASLKELQEDQSIFAPNHYCVHHGGVQHEGKIKMAEAINHNFDRKLNRVTHYDMRLQNGTILEGVAAEDIQVVRASLAEEHSHEEGCPSEEGGEAIDINAPGTEVHDDDISQLSPEEAFAAGMAAARDAINQAMEGPDGPPPEGGFSGNGPFGEPVAEEE